MFFRNMCVTGLEVAIDSLIGQAGDIFPEQGFLLTYKLSQDLLELYFYAVRHAGMKTALLINYVFMYAYPDLWKKSFCLINVNYHCFAFWGFCLKNDDSFYAFHLKYLNNCLTYKGYCYFTEACLFSLMKQKTIC